MYYLPLCLSKIVTHIASIKKHYDIIFSMPIIPISCFCMVGNGELGLCPMEEAKVKRGFGCFTGVQLLKDSY